MTDAVRCTPHVLSSLPAPLFPLLFQSRASSAKIPRLTSLFLLSFLLCFSRSADAPDHRKSSCEEHPSPSSRPYFPIPCTSMRFPSKVGRHTLPLSPHLECRHSCSFSPVKADCLAETAATCTFLSLRPRLISLVINALRTETDSTNAQHLLLSLLTCVQDLTDHETLNGVTSGTLTDGQLRAITSPESPVVDITNSLETHILGRLCVSAP